MRGSRRRIVAGLLLAAFSCAVAAADDPGKYPDKPIRLIVPLAPGGSADTSARKLAESLGKELAQSVIVDNRPGANGTIGIGAVARAPADGYTLLFAPVSLSTAKVYTHNPGFETADLVPVAKLFAGDYLISVSRNLPVKNLAELADYLRTNPGSVFHGAGAGGMLLAFEEFASMAGVKADHVNFRGEAPALTALAAGDVQVVISSITAAKPFIDSGRIRPLAVASSTRSPALPAVPTSAESGVPKFVTEFWFGLMAPAQTPVLARKKLAAAAEAFLKRPETARSFADLGLRPSFAPAEQFGDLVAMESKRWTAMAARAGIKPE